MSSYPKRSFSSHIRASTAAGSSAQSPALVARIEEKKAELEHLKELQELSSAVATQMEALEHKLSTLSDGTEAIAAVVGNWHNVLRAINMASCKFPYDQSDHGSEQNAKLTKIPGEPEEEQTEDNDDSLPQTLVRIPTEHAPVVQAQADAAQEDSIMST
ncbi:DASH complex subunit DAD2 [Geosmithia morbida]|uniref:DASH complex subunit DAD2 n=1 Tax=Geosmithia morbida TaxID=1094350 RepID=A0A9P5D1C9_9HYPO|nr:DASH complex subunit DAD2 [Geosmithia morbida]KAF4123753.1 DASH complex subunit DAD2 [Geosmithia morbida]